MSEWISVDDRMPPDANKGIHDALPYLIMTNEPYGTAGQWNVKVCTFMNNRFCGFPAGATVVTHWMNLPDLPK